MTLRQYIHLMRKDSTESSFDQLHVQAYPRLSFTKVRHHPTINIDWLSSIQPVDRGVLSATKPTYLLTYTAWVRPKHPAIDRLSASTAHQGGHPQFLPQNTTTCN
jgi:hypothetical protein